MTQIRVCSEFLDKYGAFLKSPPGNGMSTAAAVRNELWAHTPDKKSIRLGVMAVSFGKNEGEVVEIPENLAALL